MESRLLPQQVLPSLPGTRVLVFAPHPDDEVFGCGGALRQFVAAGNAVRVIVATDGGEGPPTEMERAAYVALRQDESRQAAERLGGYELAFWSYVDRQLRYGERLVQECLAAIAAWRADLVLAPSHYEIHPDHRALAMCALEAARRWGKARLALYEVGQPLPHPNVLLDIGTTFEAKLAAMRCFESQLARQDYLSQIAALNRYRTYQAHGIEAAEAYLLLSTENLTSSDPLGLFRSEHARQAALGLMADEASAPLVSIIVRSMDRPTLDEALDSIALQTYPNIEVVLVQACGPRHRPVGDWCGRFPLRVIGHETPLGRSAAANAGLEAARGAFVGFLDDDDLLLGDHVAKLMAILNQRTVSIAYSGVRMDKGGGEFQIIDEPWSRQHLLGGNFIPIHAVIFSRSLIDAGCRFDTALSCLEDWDFWLQASQYADFTHVPGVSAIYRYQLGQSGLSVFFSAQEHLANRERLYAKWRPRLSDREWGEAFFWFLQERRYAIDHLGHVQSALEATRQDCHAQIDTLRDELHQTKIATRSIRTEYENILNSRFWRWTAPLRLLIEYLR